MCQKLVRNAWSYWLCLFLCLLSSAHQGLPSAGCMMPHFLFSLSDRKCWARIIWGGWLIYVMFPSLLHHHLYLYLWLTDDMTSADSWALYWSPKLLSCPCCDHEIPVSWISIEFLLYDGILQFTALVFAQISCFKEEKNAFPKRKFYLIASSYELKTYSSIKLVSRAPALNGKTCWILEDPSGLLTTTFPHHVFCDLTHSYIDSPTIPKPLIFSQILFQPIFPNTWIQVSNFCLENSICFEF